MFGMLKNLTKAALNVAVTPVEALKDCATLGGVITGKNETYTMHRLREAQRCVDEALRAERED